MKQQLYTLGFYGYLVILVQHLFVAWINYYPKIRMTCIMASGMAMERILFIVRDYLYSSKPGPGSTKLD